MTANSPVPDPSVSATREGTYVSAATVVISSLMAILGTALGVGAAGYFGTRETNKELAASAHLAALEFDRSHRAEAYADVYQAAEEYDVVVLQDDEACLPRRVTARI